MGFKLVDNSNGNERTFDTRKEAEEKANDMVALGAHPDNLEIVEDKGVNVEHVDHSEDTEERSEPSQETDGGTHVEEVEPAETAETLPEKPNIDQDPVEWMPAHFVDEIQGVPTVNRKGYCVIAEQYGVSVTAEPVTLASETDFEYAEFRAIATTENGQDYSGFGSAHVDRQDGDDEHLLNELAETRSMKRAVAWATGMGITAVEEMSNTL